MIRIATSTTATTTIRALRKSCHNVHLEQQLLGCRKGGECGDIFQYIRPRTIRYLSSSSRTLSTSTSASASASVSASASATKSTATHTADISNDDTEKINKKKEQSTAEYLSSLGYIDKEIQKGMKDALKAVFGSNITVANLKSLGTNGEL